MSKTPMMTVEASEAQPESKATPPAWHTAGVLLLLLGMAALTLHLRTLNLVGQTHGRVLAYIATMTVEWLIVAFIAWGARWRGASLTTLAGRFSPALRSIARDLGLATAYLVAANIVLGIIGAVLGRLIHSAPNDFMKSILPHTGLEYTVWLLLALTAGICEEMIFRGYLQHQFTVWTSSAAAGIAVQGILFGAAHAYQGPAMMIVIAVYGCMFGSLAWWRKSLRPGMMAHFIQDAIGGLVLAKFALK
ncbi:MAG: CPBP family intramembrane glutamic endopeptidase [Terracidiphilus sp.]|jgi:membrane protease YdiL (CAAX protease family)